MKMLHTAYRVSDLDRSLDFYTRLGFEQVGRVVIGDGSTLVMLTLPGDDDVVTLELVANPTITLNTGNAISHLVIQVDDLVATVARLAAQGISTEEPVYHDGPDNPDSLITCFLHDPDGYRFELVQWPSGHPVAMTRADFA